MQRKPFLDLGHGLPSELLNSFDSSMFVGIPKLYTVQGLLPTPEHTMDPSVFKIGHRAITS